MAASSERTYADQPLGEFRNFGIADFDPDVWQYRLGEGRERHFAIASRLRERYDSAKAVEPSFLGRNSKCAFAKVLLEPFF
jgi:hypothetical protein